MNQIKTFVKDFFSYYFSAIVELLLIITEIIIHIFKIIINFTTNVVKPNLLEFFADVCFILLIVYQSFLAVTSNCCLGISKLFLYISKITHDKSEELLNRHWNLS